MSRRSYYIIQVPPTPVVHTLSIVGSPSVTGESCQLGLLYDSVSLDPSDGSWSIASGSQYATISQSGLLTILSGANGNGVNVSCAYQGIQAQHIMTVTYRSGASSSTTTETIVDPDTGETSTVVETVIENADGSTESNTVVTNSDGTTSETNATTNSDGSGTSTTVNYDENGNPESGSTTNTDTSGNSNTQSVEYNENGDPYVNGYTIDTSSNTSGNGETIPSGGVDTGLIPFDGRGFKIHMKYKLNMANNVNKVLLAALEPSGQNKRYSGFCVYVPNNSSVSAYGGSNSQIRNNYFGSMITGGYGDQSSTSGVSYLRYAKSGDITYTLDIVYDPAKEEAYLPNYLFSMTFMPIYASTTSSSKYGEARSTLVSNSSYLPTSLQQATITIGDYDMPDGDGHGAVNLRVLEFSVEKLS